MIIGVKKDLKLENKPEATNSEEIGEKTLNQERIDKINKLAEQYINTKDERYFNELYIEFEDEYRNAYHSIAQRDVRNNDPHEIESNYNFVLVKAMMEYEPGTNFVRLLLKSLKNKKIDMSERQSTKEKYRYKQKKDKEGQMMDPIPSLTTDQNLEQEIIDKLTKKSHREKKLLTEHFLQNTADPITTVILKEVQNHKTIKGVADAVGLQSIQVTRRLKKVRNLYDPKLFGEDLELYLS